jgi:hypothetical protein
MASVAPAAEAAQPTNLAPLPALFAYTQGLGLERPLSRPKRGIPTLVLALLWLTLAWRGTGRPERVAALDEPFLAALLGLPALPDARTLHRSLARFPARALRAAVEAAYRAELGRRTGRVWVAVDAHQVPYWGRGQPDAFQKGWSGNHGRRLRGYRLFLAIDADTGQVVTFLLARGGAADHELLALLARRCRAVLGRRLAGVVADCGFTSRAAVAALLASRIPFILGFARSAPIKARLAALSGQQRRWLRDGGAIRLGGCPWDDRLRLFAIGARTPGDARGPWVYVTSLRSAGPQALARAYRRRWRAEQAIEELLNGTDLDHLVSCRLHPNRVAIGFRLLARNLAIGHQIADADGRPDVIREPTAFRAAHLDGLGTFTRQRRTIRIQPLRNPVLRPIRLPWNRLVVRPAA